MNAGFRRSVPLLVALGLGLPAACRAQAPPPPPSEGPVIDEELLKQLIEEPESPSAADPLSSIVGRMMSIADRLDQSLVDPETRHIQDSVSEDLAKLIAEAQKRQQQQQQQQQQSSQQPQQRSQRQQVQQPKPGESGQAPQNPSQANQPARDSTTRLQKQGAVQASGADRQSLLKRAWGHLPAQAREQVQSSASEQFLPKYELETEQYFRRLAEMETPR